MENNANSRQQLHAEWQNLSERIDDVKPQNCQIGRHRIARKRRMEYDATDNNIPKIEETRCFMCLLLFGELDEFQGESVCKSCMRKLVILRNEENYQASIAAKRNKKTR